MTFDVQGRLMFMVIELRRFCEESGTAEAVFSPSQLPRVLDSVADTTGRVSMQVRGSLDARDRPTLELRLEGELRVLCQRCLRPMPVHVAVRQTLAFGEPSVDERETETFDLDAVEVLPLMAHLDLAELVEEEVLLSLPMLPRHQQCDLPAPADSGKVLPFAALGALTGALAVASQSERNQDN
ncbi:MAG: DUF177 domain-containing protein [Rhodocyclaceae bacterium]|nr:DUF177 domain-containing protein [Rhodocyclaceae bacterium]